MAPSEALRKIFTAGRPLVEQWLDIGEQIAALREVATAEGLDWSQVKALLKAQIQDERDEVGDGKRVRKILDKADFATAYADMLGLANMNENNYSAEPGHDADGVIIEQVSTTPGSSFCGQLLHETQEFGTAPDADEIQPETAAQTVPAVPVVASSAEHEAVESSVLLSEAADPGKSGAEQSASAPAPRKYHFNDTPHSDCLNPERCGGFSNLGLCPQCKAEAETARQIEEA